MRIYAVPASMPSIAYAMQGRGWPFCLISSAGKTRNYGGYGRTSHWSGPSGRSEEHTSELQSLMRNSYAVVCLKKNTQTTKSEELMYSNQDKYTTQHRHTIDNI